MTDYAITTRARLAELYREPSKLVKAKKTERLDEVTRQVLAASPFFLLATAGADGRCDVSPRGGPPGQLVALDDRRVAFPDLNGNNLIDSFSNIVENPHAGLLVITPGTDETLRIDGEVALTVDPEILDLWDGLLRRPKMAAVLTVEHAFLHCAKAFRRGEVWNPASWDRHGESPEPVEMLLAHTGLDMEAADLRNGLEEGYREQLAQDLPQR